MEKLTPDDYPEFKEFGEPPCASSDPDAFFMDYHPYHIEGTPGREMYLYEREAKITCMNCPYMAECLKYAVAHPEEQGIWGGTTEKERNNIRKGLPFRLRIPQNKQL